MSTVPQPTPVPDRSKKKPEKRPFLLLDNLTQYAALPAGPRRIAIGCAGGKHRACALIELLAQRLTDRDVPTTVTHHHAHLPRVLKI
ncbi:RapZ C-terminal domain-containing protein [Streptomyces humi]